MEVDFICITYANRMRRTAEHGLGLIDDKKCKRILTHTISIRFPYYFSCHNQLSIACSNAQYFLRHLRLQVEEHQEQSFSISYARSIVALCACPKFLGKTFCDYRQNKYAIMQFSLSATERKSDAFILCCP